MGNILKLSITSNRMLCTNDGDIFSWNELLDRIKKKVNLKKLIFEYTYVNEPCKDPLAVLHDLGIFIVAYCQNEEFEIDLHAVCTADEKGKIRNILANYYKFLGTGLKKFNIFIFVRPGDELGDRVNIRAYTEQRTHQYLSLVPINEQTFVTMFSVLRKDSIEDYEDIRDYLHKSKVATFEEYLFEEIYYILSGGVDLKQESARKNVVAMYKYLAGETIITAFLACKIYREAKSKKISSPEAVAEFQFFFNQARNISIGLQEIIDNVLKHATKKVGFLYFRIHKVRNHIGGEVPTTYYSMLDELVSCDISEYIEILVVDASDLGVCDTLRRNNGRVTSLSEIFNIHTRLPFACLSNTHTDERKDSSYPIHEITNLFFHKGLKVFNSRIIRAYGYFEVTSIDRLNNEIYLSSYRTCCSEGSHRTESCGLFGTSYRILFPIIKTNENYEDITSLLEKPLIRVIRDEQTIFQSLCSGIKNPNVITVSWPEQQILNVIKLLENSYSEETCCEALGKLTQVVIDEICGSPDQTVCIDFQAFSQTRDKSYVINMCARVLMYFSICGSFFNSSSFLIMFNVPTESVALFSEYFRLFNGQEEDGYEKVQFQHIYIYDQNGELTPIHGVNEKRNAQIKKMYRESHCLSVSNDEEETDIVFEEQERRDLLYPFEVIIGEEKTSLNPPVFMAHLSCVLHNNMTAHTFGVMHDEHVQLGSKLHIDRFYQGELVFNNNYYSLCFAYIIARNLIKKIRVGNKIVLIGYRRYSELMLKRIERFLVDLGYHVTSIIYEEEIQLLEKEIIEHIVNDSIGINLRANEISLVYIAPIASTLKTFNKMTSDFRLCLFSMGFGDYKYQEIYYCVILARNGNGKERTELEKEFNWEKVDIEEQFVEIYEDQPFREYKEYSIKTVYYITSEQVIWTRANECACQKNGTHQLLLKTQKSSLELETNLGLPYNIIHGDANRNPELLDYVSIIYDRLAKCLYYGHVERNQGHFLYYFDTNLFFGLINEPRNKEDEMLATAVSKWLKVTRIEINKPNNQGYVNVILIPAHYSNGDFSERIFSEVFDSIGIIIREDFSREYYSDFMIKYSFLRDIKKKRFVFIDDIIQSGGTFRRAASLISDYLGDEDSIYIITLLDRLDYLSYGSINQIHGKKINLYSFVQVFIPRILEQTDKCWVCEERRNLIQLIPFNTSLVHKYAVNKIAVDLKCEIAKDEGAGFSIPKPTDSSKSLYLQQRFLLANSIYKLIYENCKSLLLYDTVNAMSELKRILGIDRITNEFLTNIITSGQFWGKEESTLYEAYSYKINFIKIITTPYLSQFLLMKHLACDICNAEFERLLTQDQTINSATAAIKISYLMVLIKKMIRLNGYNILEEGTFQHIWDFYQKQSEIAQNDKPMFVEGVLYAIVRGMSEDNVFALRANSTAYSILETHIQTSIFQNAKSDLDSNKIFEICWIILLEKQNILTSAFNSYRHDDVLFEKFTTINAASIEVNMFDNYYYEQLKQLLAVFKIFLDEHILDMRLLAFFKNHKKVIDSFSSAIARDCVYAEISTMIRNIGNFVSSENEIKWNLLYYKSARPNNNGGEYEIRQGNGASVESRLVCRVIKHDATAIIKMDDIQEVVSVENLFGIFGDVNYCHSVPLCFSGMNKANIMIINSQDITEIFMRIPFYNEGNDYCDDSKEEESGAILKIDMNNKTDFNRAIVFVKLVYWIRNYLYDAAKHQFEMTARTLIKGDASTSINEEAIRKTRSKGQAK